MTGRASATWQAVRVQRLWIAAAALALTISGCSGDSGGASDDQSPSDRLAEAKQGFDDAESIGFTLATKELPSDLEGLLSAKGTGTHDPAFTGEVRVQAGIDVTAPVVAVDDKVYAKLPFSPYTQIDPAAYGAPDPADLMDPQGGISSLFTATEDPETGDSTRDGKTVLTEIEGTIPGESMKDVFPSAGSDDFDVVYTLTDDNAVDRVRIAGPFYEGYDDVTYTLELDLTSDEVDIRPPV